MEMIGSGDKYNVVVELGRIKGHDSSEEDWTTSRRYFARKDDDPARVTSPVVEELPRTDMGDYRHLADFANWAKTRYPAKKYMLTVWNPGAGAPAHYAELAWARDSGWDEFIAGLAQP